MCVVRLRRITFHNKYGVTNENTFTPAFSFTPAAPKVNQAVTFKDESTGSPTSWAWDLGDGTTSTLQNPTKTYNKAGNYTVKLTINKQGATAATNSNTLRGKCCFPYQVLRVPLNSIPGSAGSRR